LHTKEVKPAKKKGYVTEGASDKKPCRKSKKRKRPGPRDAHSGKKRLAKKEDSSRKGYRKEMTVPTKREKRRHRGKTTRRRRGKRMIIWLSPSRESHRSRKKNGVQVRCIPVIRHPLPEGKKCGERGKRGGGGVGIDRPVNVRE